MSESIKELTTLLVDPLTRLVVSEGWQTGSLDWSVALMMLPGVERKKDRDGEMERKDRAGCEQLPVFPGEKITPTQHHQASIHNTRTHNT